MRITVFMRNILLCLAIATPALLRAQFQQPTDEELKMTADPKAPGAAAVYLNIEEIADDPLHHQSFYARIKVLTEKGKELATVTIPYMRSDSKIVDIKGRTIHPDGTIIPLVGKPEDLMKFKTVSKTGDREQVNQRVFTLPSVEVGSIIEYRYDWSYDDNYFSSPFWEIQRPYLVRKAHYMFTPFKAFLPSLENATDMYLEDDRGRRLDTLIWWPRLPAGFAVKPDAKGRYTVDVTDVPPAPDEEWTPPINSYLYRVVFYYKSSGSAAAFWKDDGKLWSKDVDRFANTSKPIHDAVDGLIAPGDSDLDKAKKLYKAVQDLDNTDYSRHKSESELKQLKLKVAKRAEDTWAQKSGSSEDIAQLYLAMLRAAGLTAYAVKVVNRGEGMFDQTYLTFNQLDDTLVYLSTGGKEILLDPGEKMCPFQTVNWRHSGAGGVRQTAGDPEITFTALQEYPANKITRVGDVTLDPQGIMTGNFSFSMIGQEALRWRQDALEYDLDEVKKQFDHSLESIVPEGTEAHVDHFLGLDNPDLNLIAVIKVHGTLGAATSRRLLVPAFFFQSRGTAPFVAQDKREEPIDMHFGEEVFDQVTYHLPEGFTVEGAPQDAKITWPQQALLVDKTVPRAGQLIVARTFARAFTFAKPDEYQDLRGFYQKVAAADQQELVLTAAPAAKGN